MATKKNTSVKHGDKEYEYYRITRTIGHKYVDGKKVPIKKQFVGTSKGNAEQKFKEWQEEQIRLKYEKEASDLAERMRPFGEYAMEFTDEVLPNTSYAHDTISSYTNAFRKHVQNSYLMKIPLCEVNINTIMNFYDNLQVTKAVLAVIHNWLRAFYKWIARNEKGENVAALIENLPPKPSSKRSNTIVVWEPEEIKAIFEKAKGYRFELLLYVMYYEGLRISEALGLKRSDIDLKKNTISVNRQNRNGLIIPPKARSYRTLPLHPEVKRVYLEHMSRRKDKIEYIFINKNKRLYYYQTVHASLNLFYKHNGLPQKKIHAYRATFCTELCRRDVPLEVASKLMGHKSITTTATHYALVKSDVMIDAINKL